MARTEALAGERLGPGAHAAEAAAPTGGDLMGGRPPTAGLRSAMEARLGFDFAKVRIHEDEGARDLAAAHGARALTFGHHVFLGPGELPSDTALMAHEFAHVAQQQALGAPFVQRQTSAAAGRRAFWRLLALRAEELRNPSTGPSRWTAALDRYPVSERAAIQAHIDGELANLSRSQRGMLMNWGRQDATRSRTLAGRALPGGNAGHIVGDRAASSGFRQAPATGVNDPRNFRVESADINQWRGRAIEGPVTRAYTAARAQGLPHGPAQRQAVAQVTAGRLPQAAPAAPAPAAPALAPPASDGAPHAPAAHAPAASAAPAAPPAPTVAPAAGAAAHAPAPPSGTRAAASAIARETGRTLRSELRLLRVASALRGVGTLLQGISALQMLDRFATMAQSGLAGDGFVLGQHVAAARRLARDTRRRRDEYAGYSERLQMQGWQFLGVRGDPTAAGQTASELFDVVDRLRGLRAELPARQQRVRVALREVTAKRRAAEAILNSPSASTAIAVATFGTAELAAILGASQDLTHIGSSLRDAADDLDALGSALDADIGFAEAWSRNLFGACEHAGVCATAQVRIPFVGSSTTLHFIPGAAEEPSGPADPAP